MKQTIKMLFILIFTFLNFSSAQSSDLTEQEKEYLKNKKTLKIAIDENWKPYSFHENGKPMGVLYDFGKVVADKLGLELEIVKMNYDNTYNSVQNNKIDLMFEAIESMKTDSTVLSSQSFFPFVDGIISKKNYSKIESLKDKIIALDASSKDYFSEFYNLNSKNIVTYKNDKELISLLYNDKIDAAINDFQKYNYLKNDYDLTNQLIVKSVDDSRNYIKTYALFPKENEELRNIFDKLINKDDYESIASKWRLNDKEKLDEIDVQLNLTEKEKEYLKNNPTIKIGYPTVFEPLLLKDELGNINGLYPDLYKFIANKLNINIEYKIDVK